MFCNKNDELMMWYMWIQMLSLFYLNVSSPEIFKKYLATGTVRVTKHLPIFHLISYFFHEI